MISSIKHELTSLTERIKEKWAVKVGDRRERDIRRQRIQRKQDGEDM